MTHSRAGTSAVLAVVAWAIFLLTVAGINGIPSSTDGFLPLLLLAIGTIVGLIVAIFAIRAGWKSLRAQERGRGRVLAVAAILLGGMYVIFNVAGILVGYLLATLVGPPTDNILRKP